MRRLPIVPLLPAWGVFTLLSAQPPDSIRTFSSPTDSTWIYFSQAVFQPLRVDTLNTLRCTAGGCGATAPSVSLTREFVPGVPFGLFGLWQGAQPRETPVPFTASQNFTSPGTVIPMIETARASKQALILVLTGGSDAKYSSDGAFDLAKWERRIDQYNTGPIRDAIAAGVADGTVLGNSLMDEPETKKWGGVMTKPLLDSMAAYAKQYFPTLPMGPSHGPDGYYQWRPNERYRVVDYVLNQYAYGVTKGDVTEWRDKVLAQAKRDGVAVAFSMNILNGGETATRDGRWACPTGTAAGRGTKDPVCRMTAAQIRDWGKTLGPAGCVMLMWRYDETAMAQPDNQQAMRDVAAGLARAPRRRCTRS